MSNCLFWSVAMWFRRGRVGSIRYRRSHLLWYMPHFLYEEGGRVWSYRPVSWQRDYMILFEGARVLGRSGQAPVGEFLK